MTLRAGVDGSLEDLKVVEHLNEQGHGEWGVTNIIYP